MINLAKNYSSNIAMRVLAFAIVVAVLLAIRPVDAAGSAQLTLSPASGSYALNSNLTVTINENSGGEAVNAVSANLTYDASKLEFVSISMSGGAFTIPAQQSGGGGNVVIEAGNVSTVTGNQKVASVTFRAIAVGSAVVSTTSSSAIVRASDSQNVWNESVTSATFTLSAPAPAPAPASPPVSNPGSTNTNTGSSNQSNSQQPATSGQPTEEEVEVNAGLNDEEPVPVSAYSDPTGYPVAIKVVNKEGKPVSDVEVSLGEQTATSDGSGVASFTSVLAGKYVLSANGSELDINIVTGEPAEVQDFVLEIEDKGLMAQILPFLLGAGVLVLIATLGYLLSKKLRARNTTNNLVSGDSVDISKPNTSEDIMSGLRDPDVPKPDQVVEPTDSSSDSDKKR